MCKLVHVVNSKHFIKEKSSTLYYENEHSKGCIIHIGVARHNWAVHSMKMRVNLITLVQLYLNIYICARLKKTITFNNY